MRTQRASPGSAETEPGWFLVSAPGIGGDIATSVPVVGHELERKKVCINRKVNAQHEEYKTMSKTSNPIPSASLGAVRERSSSKQGVTGKSISVVGKDGSSQELLHDNLLIPFDSLSAHINEIAHSEREPTDQNSLKFPLPLTLECLASDKQGADAFYIPYH